MGDLFGDADLAIAAYPLTNAQDQKTYFGIDLSAVGVLPIWLSIANRSPAKRFLVAQGRHPGAALFLRAREIIAIE